MSLSFLSCCMHTHTHIVYSLDPVFSSLSAQGRKKKGAVEGKWEAGSGLRRGRSLVPQAGTRQGRQAGQADRHAWEEGGDPGDIVAGIVHMHVCLCLPLCPSPCTFYRDGQDEDRHLGQGLDYLPPHPPTPPSCCGLARRGATFLYLSTTYSLLPTASTIPSHFTCSTTCHPQPHLLPCLPFFPNSLPLSL